MRVGLLLCLIFLSKTIAFTQIKANTPKSTIPSFQFIENKNQWDKNILFRAVIPGGYLYIQQNSLYYVFYDNDAIRRLHPTRTILTSATNRQAESRYMINAHAVKVTFEGSDSTGKWEGANPTESVSNFFHGKESSHWATGVNSFNEITCKNIYPGISIRFYTKYNTLKYEFIAEPGSDISKIKMKYEGSEGISIEDYNLLIKTSLNVLVETRPYSFQIIGKKEQKVPADFQLKDNLVSFKFPKGYDRKQVLVIDPTLVFSSYSGSVSDNWAFTATYDTLGNLYSGGIIASEAFNPSNYNVSAGAFQMKFGGGTTDVAIMKFSPDGKKLLYATYLGGNDADVPHSLITDKYNNLIILGTTSSANFPMPSASAFDISFNGGPKVSPLDFIYNGGGSPIIYGGGIDYEHGSDLFVAKISPNGDQLLSATYIGGSDNDGLNDTGKLSFFNYGDPFKGEIALDSLQNIYIASSTSSSDFPLRNPVQNAKKTGQDGFIMKLKPDLTDIQWSTYIGGNNHDAVYGMKVTSAGKIFICGITRSTDLPVSAGVIKPSISGDEDGFVAVYNQELLQHLTYLGTNSSDQAYLLDLDNDENVVVYGLSLGSYPVTSNVFKNDNSGQFIHGLNNTLTNTLFSTVIGTGKGSPDISPTAFLVNDCGSIYLSGWGGSINNERGTGFSTTLGLPVTADAFKTTTSGDDFYFMILEKDAKSLLYATYFGEDKSPAGNHVDGGTCRFDKKGIIYHVACVCSGSSNFPTTSGVVSNKNNSGNCNAVGFKFDLEFLKADFNILDSKGKITEKGCAPFSVKLQNNSINAESFEWIIDTLKTSTKSDTIFTFDKPGDYSITLKVYNKFTCKPSVETKILHLVSSNFTINSNANICLGDSVQLSATGGTIYTWVPADGLSNPTISNPIAKPVKTTEYTVIIKDGDYCETTKTVKVEITDVGIDFDLITPSDCDDTSSIQFVNKTTNALTYQWDMGNGVVFTDKEPLPYSYPKAGTYVITLTSFGDKCQLSKSKTITVENQFLPPNVITTTPASGSNKGNLYYVLPEKGWKLEIYNRWGKTIYKSDSYQNDWGKDVAAGVYYYSIVTPGGRKCRGWLQAIR